MQVRVASHSNESWRQHSGLYLQMLIFTWTVSCRPGSSSWHIVSSLCIRHNGDGLHVFQWQRTNTLWTALWGRCRMNRTQVGICIKVPHHCSQLAWQNAQALPRRSHGMLFEMPLVFIFHVLPHMTGGCEGRGLVETRRTGDIEISVSNTNFSLNREKACQIHR